MCIGVIGAGTGNFLLALCCGADPPDWSESFFSEELIQAGNALVFLAVMYLAQHKKES